MNDFIIYTINGRVDVDYNILDGYGTGCTFWYAYFDKLINNISRFILGKEIILN